MAEKSEECQYNPTNSPCKGKVKVINLFAGHKFEHEINGYSVHAIPVCEAHINDHICILRGAMAKGIEILDECTREQLQQFDKRLS